MWMIRERVFIILERPYANMEEVVVSVPQPPDPTPTVPVS